MNKLKFIALYIASVFRVSAVINVRLKRYVIYNHILDKYYGGPKKGVKYAGGTWHIVDKEDEAYKFHNKQDADLFAMYLSAHTFKGFEAIERPELAEVMSLRYKLLRRTYHITVK